MKAQSWVNLRKNSFVENKQRRSSLLRFIKLYLKKPQDFLWTDVESRGYLGLPTWVFFLTLFSSNKWWRMKKVQCCCLSEVAIKDQLWSDDFYYALPFLHDSQTHPSALVNTDPTPAQMLASNQYDVRYLQKGFWILCLQRCYFPSHRKVLIYIFVAVVTNCFNCKLKKSYFDQAATFTVSLIASV